jgi:hypothetical protein
MMWIERLPAAVTATGLDGVLAAATALGLDGLTTTATESELAQRLLDKSGDKVRHFWFI